MPLKSPCIIIAIGEHATINIAFINHGKVVTLINTTDISHSTHYLGKMLSRGNPLSQTIMN